MGIVSMVCATSLTAMFTRNQSPDKSSFSLANLSNSAMMLGFTNYTLEMAPAALRPGYLGLSNTLMGIMALVPALGGWLLEATSYPMLFAVAAFLTLGGFILALTLRPSSTIAAELVSRA